jgi:hypothetical protein
MLKYKRHYLEGPELFEEILMRLNLFEKSEIMLQSLLLCDFRMTVRGSCDTWLFMLLRGFPRSLKALNENEALEECTGGARAECRRDDSLSAVNTRFIASSSFPLGSLNLKRSSSG